VKILGSIKNTSTDQVLKGKQPMLDSGAQRINLVEVKKPPFKRWLKPPLGWVKLTIDGSFKSDDGSASIGMVLHDYAGTVIFSACRSLASCEQALEEEVSACLEGLELGLLYSDLPIVVESDCSQLISSILANGKDRSPYLHSISEIKFLDSDSRICNFVKVHRSQVRISHCLANLTRAENRTQFWLGSGPECVVQVLESESLVIPSD
jgi:hypothetical protein